MNPRGLRQLWFLVRKDFVIEYRTGQAWPAMLLLGVIVTVLFSLPQDGLGAERSTSVGIVLWLATLFSGLIAIERTSTVEQPDGCWDALSLYPLAGSTVYLAKLTVNVISLLVLQCLLVPLVVVLTGVSLTEPVWAIGLVAVLGSIGMASVGTLVSTLTPQVGHRRTVLVLLTLPLLLPLLLSAAEATRLIAQHDLGHAWWCWIQFLAAFAIVFITGGITLFGLLHEN